MTASPTVILSTLFTLLTTAGGITSLSIIGEHSANRTLDGNITITWRVQDIVHTQFAIFVNDVDTPENQLFRINKLGFNSNISFTASKDGRHDNLRPRSSASYYYTGNLGGNETGQVVLTIKDLKLEDGGKFILRDERDHKTYLTVLSVQYGPKDCSVNKKYIVNNGDMLNVTTGFCGKPQPTVTCKFGGKTYTSVNITEINQYNYTYTFNIPTNLKPCEKKQLSCTAVGNGDPVITKTNVVGNSPEEKKVSGGVCAGHIIGFEIGIILICVFIYVYIVKWKATKETCRLTGFIIAVVVGLALMIGLSVSYADLRNSIDNHNCGKGSLGGCDKAFIAFGVIGFVALVIVVIISVKVLKDGRSKTWPDGSRETTPLKSANNPSGTVKKTGGATETSEQAHNQNV